MIALFGSEGGYTLDLLCASKPELFGTPTSAYVPPSAKKKTRNSDSVHHSDPVHLPPNPRRLVRILAAVGHSMPSAVADIVDNSISADATEINITFREPDQGHGRWMAISDNGKGMDSDRLAEAMRIGSETEYESGDLGKFGYGLKGLHGLRRRALQSSAKWQERLPIICRGMLKRWTTGKRVGQNLSLGLFQLSL